LAIAALHLNVALSHRQSDLKTINKQLLYCTGLVCRHVTLRSLLNIGLVFSQENRYYGSLTKHVNFYVHVHCLPYIVKPAKSNVFNRTQHISSYKCFSIVRQ